MSRSTPRSHAIFSSTETATNGGRLISRNHESPPRPLWALFSGQLAEKSQFLDTPDMRPCRTLCLTNSRYVSRINLAPASIKYQILRCDIGIDKLCTLRGTGHHVQQRATGTTHFLPHIAPFNRGSTGFPGPTKTLWQGCSLLKKKRRGSLLFAWPMQSASRRVIAWAGQ